jgi:hypothetical protein
MQGCTSSCCGVEAGAGLQYNPIEAIMTSIMGGRNGEAALDCGVERVMAPVP